MPNLIPIRLGEEFLPSGNFEEDPSRLSLGFTHALLSVKTNLASTSRLGRFVTSRNKQGTIEYSCIKKIHFLFIYQLGNLPRSTLHFRLFSLPYPPLNSTSCANYSLLRITKSSEGHEAGKRLDINYRVNEHVCR